MGPVTIWGTKNRLKIYEAMKHELECLKMFFRELTLDYTPRHNLEYKLRMYITKDIYKILNKQESNIFYIIQIDIFIECYRY